MSGRKDPTDDPEATGYQSMRVPAAAYRELLAVRDELLRRGLDALPADLVPTGSRSISLGVVCGIAAKALRRALEEKGPGT